MQSVYRNFPKELLYCDIRDSLSARVSLAAKQGVKGSKPPFKNPPLPAAPGGVRLGDGLEHGLGLGLLALVGVPAQRRLATKPVAQGYWPESS